jgi:hypothetical protein
MPIYARTLMLLFACLMLSSCATRIFCATDSPRLPRRRPSVQGDKSETARLSRYVVSQQAKDGFVVESVTEIRVLPMCGMGLMAPLFTLGLLPANLPYPVEVTVTGRIGGKSQSRTYHVALYSLTSTWIALVPRSFDDHALARGFLGAIASRDPLPQRENHKWKSQTTKPIANPR